MMQYAKLYLILFPITDTQRLSVREFLKLNRPPSHQQKKKERTAIREKEEMEIREKKSKYDQTVAEWHAHET